MGTRRRTTSPREQRRAFYWQDLYALWQLLRALVNPSEHIVEIAIEKSDAPHVDDVVVRYPRRTEYQQLKHVKNRAFSGADLFGAAAGEQSLCKKLYAGWMSLGGSRSPRVHVRVVTNARPSGEKGRKEKHPTPLDLDRVCQQLRVPKGKRPTLPTNDTRLRREVAAHIGVSERKVEPFLRALRFSWNERAEDSLKQEIGAILTDKLLTSLSRVDADLDALAGRVYDLATRREAGNFIGRAAIEHQVRVALGLPVSRSHDLIALPSDYVPRAHVAEMVLQKARELGHGYLRVMGRPGSGKTTLATQIFESAPREEVLCCYYAFDPEKSSELERSERVRGWSLIVQLSQALRARYPSIPLRTPARERVGDALDELWSDLARLGRVRRRIVMIDGIDHVARAGAGDDPMSLLGALRPHAPPGVVFILLGQPDWRYPRWIENTPAVEIPPFTRDETRRLVLRALGWKPGRDVGAFSDKLHKETAGNPLSLFYSVHALKGCRSPRDPQADAGVLPLFHADVEDTYTRLLADAERAVSSPSLMAELRAWLAVAEVPFDAEHVQKSFPEIDRMKAADVLTSLSPLCARVGSRQRLFHDDFRRFLMKAPGVDSECTRRAHSRHAAALVACPRPGELGALAEHLWMSRRWDELQRLPASKDVMCWLADTDAFDMERMVRLALAASFALASDSAILSNSLLYARLAQLEAEVARDADQGPPLRSLAQWSVVMPPAEVKGTLTLRANALRAASLGFGQDAALAAEVADRFAIGIGAPGNEVAFHQVEEYAEAEVEWRLRSGQGATMTGPLKGPDAWSRACRSGFRSVLEHETDSAMLESWVGCVEHSAREAGRDVVAAAWKHLTRGAPDAARALVRAILRPGVALAAAEERDAVVVGDVLRLQTAGITERHARAGMGFEDVYRAADRPEQWRQLAFHGYVLAAVTTTPTIEALQLPEKIRTFVEQQTTLGPEAVGYAWGVWRLGTTAGLARRKAGLVADADLVRVCGWVLDVPDDGAVRERAFRLSSRTYLPFLAHAITNVPGSTLAHRMRELLIPAAKGTAMDATDSAEAVREALWLVDEESWRALARDTLARESFPSSGPGDRERWWRYWRDGCMVRGVAVLPDMVRVGRVARFGVEYEKQDVAGVAMLLLERIVVSGIDPASNIKRAGDLLVRLHGENEGGRTARRHLPTLLALALRIEIRVFVELLDRLCWKARIDHPFEELLGETVVEYLRLCGGTESSPLPLLWRLVACAPEGFRAWGSDADDAPGTTAMKGILVRLQESGEGEEASKVGEWLDAMREMRRTAEGRERHGQLGTASEDGGPPNIEDIEIRWFHHGWREHRFLREYVAAGGEDAWRRACGRLAPKILNGVAPWEAMSVAASLVDIHTQHPDELRELFERAMDDLESVLRFQAGLPDDSPQPAADEGVPPEESWRRGIASIMVTGLMLTHTETVRAALRGLADLARQPKCAGAVEAALLTPLLERADGRVTGWALMVLREIGTLGQPTRVRVQEVTEHPNAWCRWLACSILGETPTWTRTPVVTVPMDIAARNAGATEARLGSLTFADRAGIRENYVKRLTAATGLPEDRVRREIASGERCAGGSRKEMWNLDRGRRLVPSDIDDAVGVAVGAMAADLPDAMRARALAQLAPADPWLLTAPPVVQAPAGWMELASAEERHGAECERIHRSLGLVHPGTFQDARSDGAESVLAEVAAHQLCPERPKSYAWVSEAWGGLGASPVVPDGPVLPLSFLNKPFSSLMRSDFGLVPRWDDPIMGELSYRREGRPCWRASDGREVIVGARSEKGRATEREDDGLCESVWSTSWWADPDWLAAMVKGHAALVIRFWRVESWTPGATSSTVSFGLERVDLVGTMGSADGSLPSSGTRKGSIDELTSI